jgi:hypothetical protein
MITWRSLQAQLPAMALCTALAMLALIPAVMFAPHARAQTPYLNAWIYQEARESTTIISPLTLYSVPITLKHPPALDSSGNLIYPVLVFIGNPATGDTLAYALDYKLTGNTIQFAPNPINPPRVDELGASEAQVVYWWGQDPPQ